MDSSKKRETKEPTKRRKVPKKGWGKRKKKRKDDKGRPRVITADESEGVFYEVERILARRKRRGQLEYLVHWKGCSDLENTWEPADNLCDTAFQEAVQLEVEEAERKLGIHDDDGPEKEVDDQKSGDKGRDEQENQKGPALSQEGEDSRWDWTDEGQLEYREIERIHVDNPEARQKVTEARRSGIPVCLVGHRGWGQFAKRWLKPTDDELLDLSKTVELDMDKMQEDIGNEAVPIVKRKYDETDPIHSEISASTFLKKCWPTTASLSNANRKSPLLYLHQWQFPLSETAAPKLCGEGCNSPLPNDILGEDLLKYWLDHINDSPFQYVFMGREDTMSNLHRDNGGLLITIAPIIGEKEVVLVHRSDGSSCFYHLRADLSKVNLHRFPLMASARIWKSVVKPGEILLMPQGTYHQCRNITPCLSYSRFYLDTVNLKAFLESMLDGDAPEIEHDEVIWNATTELRTRLDGFVDKVRTEVRRSGRAPSDTLSQDIVRTVDTLRALRHICREIARRFRLQQKENASSWEKLVDDIDGSLHDFRFRQSARLPPFRPKREKQERPLSSSMLTNGTTNDEDVQSAGETSDSERTLASSLERAFHRTPRLPPEKEGMVIPDAVGLTVGDRVAIRVYSRLVQADIVRIEDHMKAAFIRYEDLPPCHDEYQPFDQLRVPIAGESSVEVADSDIQPGKIVHHCDHGEEYRAEIKSWRLASFYLLSLQLDGGRCCIERWVTRDSIIEKVQTSEESWSPKDRPNLASRVLEVSPSSFSPFRAKKRKTMPFPQLGTTTDTPSQSVVEDVEVATEKDIDGCVSRSLSFREVVNVEISDRKPSSICGRKSAVALESMQGSADEDVNAPPSDHGNAQLDTPAEPE